MSQSVDLLAGVSNLHLIWLLYVILCHSPIASSLDLRDITLAFKGMESRMGVSGTTPTSRVHGEREISLKWPKL